MIRIFSVLLLSWLLGSGALPTPRREFVMPEGSGSLTGFSRNGRLVGVSGGTAQVAVFQTGTGLLLRTYRGHQQPVVAFAFSPRLDTVVSVDASGQAHAWNPETLTTLARWQAPAGVTRVLFSPDGQQALLASRSRRWLWNLRYPTAEPVELEFNGPVVGDITALSFSTDGTRLATGFETGLVLVQDLKTRTHQQMALFRTSVQGLSFGRDSLLAVAGTPEFRSWHPGTSTPPHTQPLEQPAVAIAFDEDAQLVLLGSPTGLTSVWSPPEKQLIFTCQGKGRTSFVQFQPEGSLILAAFTEDRAKTWKLQ